jgi:HEAT repeat protein
MVSKLLLTLAGGTIGVICIIFLVCVCCAEDKGGLNTGPAASVQILPERLEKIEKALKSKDDNVFRRALFEAAPLVAERPELVKSIIMAGLPTTHSETWLLACRVLGNARGESVQEMIRAYAENPQKYQILPYVLGRIGKEAQGAAPVLRKRLNDPKVDRVEKMRLQCVLASLGAATAEEIEAIRKAIVEVGGHPSYAAGVMHTMFVLGRNEWIDDQIRANLFKALSQYDDPEAQLTALFVFSTLGPKAGDEVTKTIYSLFAFWNPRYFGSSGATFAGLALVVLDPPRRQTMLIATFRVYAGNGSWTDPNSMGIPDAIMSAIPAEDLVKDVKELLTFGDERVATEAAYFLQLIGPSAASATPALCRLVETGKDKDLRKAAAESLGIVAIPADVPSIRELSLKQGLPPELKQELEESIRVIELRD